MFARAIDEQSESKEEEEEEEEDGGGGGGGVRLPLVPFAPAPVILVPTAASAFAGGATAKEVQ